MVMALRALATSDHYRLVVNKIRQDAARDFDNVLAGLQGDALHLAAGRASAMNELLRNLGEIDA